VTAATNIPLPQPAGSTSELGQPGSSSAQGQDADGDDDISLIDNEDVLDLLDKGESLELVEFGPTVESGKTWEASDIINTFLTKYFTKALDQREIDNIMEGFLKLNC